MAQKQPFTVSVKSIINSAYRVTSSGNPDPDLVRALQFALLRHEEWPAYVADHEQLSAIRRYCPALRRSSNNSSSQKPLATARSPARAPDSPITIVESPRGTPPLRKRARPHKSRPRKRKQEEDEEEDVEQRSEDDEDTNLSDFIVHSDDFGSTCSEAEAEDEVEEEEDSDSDYSKSQVRKKAVHSGSATKPPPPPPPAEVPEPVADAARESTRMERLDAAFAKLIQSTLNNKVDYGKFFPPGRVRFEVCKELTHTELGKLVQLSIWTFHGRKRDTNTPCLWGFLIMGPALQLMYKRYVEEHQRHSFSLDAYIEETYGVKGLNSVLLNNYVRFYELFRLCPIMATVDSRKSELNHLLLELIPKVTEWVKTHKEEHYAVPDLDLKTVRAILKLPLPEPDKKSSNKKRRSADATVEPRPQAAATVQLHQQPPPQQREADLAVTMPERPPVPQSVSGERIPTPGDLLPGPRPTALKASAFNMPR